MLHFQKRDYANASNQLAKAAELGLQEAPLFNFLGICYSRTDQAPKAVMAYKKAVNLDPNFAEAHLNLAYEYQKMNKLPAAEAEYKIACGLAERFCDFVPTQRH
jgi:Tfp pilus assembly protein PilF